MFPGSIEVKLGNWLRAVGALAVFVALYSWNPALLASDPDALKGPKTGSTLVRCATELRSAADFYAVHSYLITAD